MFAQIQTYALVGLFAVLVYLYYDNTMLNMELNKTIKDKELLSENVKNQEQYISKIKLEIEEVKNLNSQMLAVKEQQQNVIETKKEVFKRHDLSKSSYAKPKLVQNIINKNTFSEFRCIENITKGIYDECK